MKLKFFITALFFFVAHTTKAQSGCITCALSEILKEEWKNPNYAGTGGGTFGWTFNVRNRFGRQINADEIQRLENAANNNNSGVQSVHPQAVVYGNDGQLQYKIVPHAVTLSNGETYFVYQKYIVGFY